MNDTIKITCPECGKEIEIKRLDLVYGIPFKCPECGTTLKSK
jgi:endogenous inhibitor of DNA gyrase (YacG/DUF329 family)